MLLPEEFYLATILNQNVETPCTFNQTELCRAFGYPNITIFDKAFGVGGYIQNGDLFGRPPKEFYTDIEVLYLYNKLI